jgi:hypothetical protein
MGLTALLPLQRKLCYRFLSPLKIPSSLVGFEPISLGSNGKHATTRPPRVPAVVLNAYTGNSQLSGIMEERKVTDNPKPWLKQKQSKHSRKRI